MTPEQIIEMAKQAGCERLPGRWDGWSCHLDELQRFAQLVRNAALEEAAEVCGFGMSMTEREIQIADKVRSLKS